MLSFDQKMKLKNQFDGNLQMGAKKFNKITGRDKHLNNRRLNKLNYIDPDSGQLYSELSLNRKCPLCGSNNYEILFVKDGFSHVRCNICTMVYVTPTLKEEKTHSFYLNEDSYTEVLMNEVQLEMDKKRFNYSLDIIEELVARKNKIIDIGAGPGFFLQQTIARKWKATGVEFNQFSVKKLKSIGIHVIDQPMHQANIENGAFDCATIWAVLEHIINPNEFLQDIHKILTPDGILAVIVPNFDSLVVRILHDKCVTFGGESHVNHFNEKTLTQMMKNNHFEKIEIETLFTEINTIQNYLSFTDPYLGVPDYFIDILTPEYIHKNLLGYALMGFYKKG